MPSPFSKGQIPTLTGKIALVTGGNNGIGFETVRQLALHGAKVWLACRTSSKGMEAVRILTEAHPDISLDLNVVRIALDDLESVAKCAETFLSKVHRLDILICNAGIMGTPYKLTKDGFEQQFQVNHLSHFLLVQCLLPLLRETGKISGHPSRIVMLSSMGHHMVSLDPFHSPDYSSTHSVNRPFSNVFTEWILLGPHIRYAQSKLANILFAREINKREGDGYVKAVAVHPGPVSTDLWRHNPLGRIIRMFLITPAHGALATLYAATDPEVEEKRLWDTFLGTYGVPMIQSKYSLDSKLAEDLWNLSEAIITERGHSSLSNERSDVHGL